ATAVAVPRAIPGFRWTLDLRWETLRPLLSYSGWVSVSNVVSPLLVYLERFLLASLAGVAAVAYYTAPYEAITRLLIVPAGLAGALFPALSASGAGAAPASFDRLLGRPLRFLLLTLAPLVIVLIVCACPRMAPWRFLGARGGRAAAAVAAFVVGGVVCVAVTPGGIIRIVLAAGAAMAFAAAAWRFVLDDAERAGLRRVLT